jgi:peptidase M1-like protein
VTKVLLQLRVLAIVLRAWFGAIVLGAIVFGAIIPLPVYAQGQNPPDKPAEALYLQLGQVGLDPAQVYQVRGATLERAGVHISLEDGTIAFTENVMGRITGAFFEGDGEVLVVPPTDVERKSMSLFTEMAILEEHFATAYFRFNDDVANELVPGLRQIQNKREFVDRWDSTARNLAQNDAIRLLESFSRMLPAKDGTAPSENAPDPADRFLHARLQGARCGVFDVYSDSRVREQVQVGQSKAADNGNVYYNVWTSFSPAAAGSHTSNPPERTKPHEDWISIHHYAITTEVEPPTQIHTRAVVQMEVKDGGPRIIFFELSRFLQVESVKLGGQPVEFIHNPAVEGTQLARRGNDVLAVVLPGPAKTKDNLELEFVYGGEVLAEAGSGLLYVGERGTWYPNRGMVMANFDLQFTYPNGWMLVATGKPTPVAPSGESQNGAGAQRTRWVSERAIPFAGFNLGKYKVFKTKVADVTVETYATQSVERSFPSVPIQTIDPAPSDANPHPMQVIVPRRPSPAETEEAVGEAAARAIQYYAERFGPYPYSNLALTQLPGVESQGWPGLVFLSSYAFLDKDEREQLHFEPYKIWLQESIPAHETAHQWWGDLVGWDTYRDQWISEGLSNYCALMMLQEKNPAGFKVVMEEYRHDLVKKNKEGVAPMDAGPVTLGMRLLSSRFPDGYDAISYGRATWLFHMLRSMMRDGAVEEKDKSAHGIDEPFVRALRKVRQRYEGKSISTQELFDVFAEELPASLRYEGKRSLDWFLDGWVNGTALPKLELKSVKFTPKGAGLVVSGTIVQKDAPQDLVTSVPVYAASAGKPVLLGRVFADGEESSFHISAPAGTHKIVLDPNETILTNPK